MKFYRTLVLAPLFLAALALAADRFQLEPGFVSLFNGKDMTGWSYSPTDVFTGKKASSDGRFFAKDGMLVVNGKKAGEKALKLWTTQEFAKDFVLKLEFRAEVNADSGVYVRGPQIQVRDYLVAGPEQYKNLKKYRPQDWNELVVRVQGGIAHCSCNGEILNPEMKVPAKGPIGVESDRGQMEYRRIRIKESS